ncbi:hypothetical protein C2E21_6124 [Chlorella sorokiniana]|uniref:Uncharacterized protein n=1 Tax=Chlorella sorokiniana TaxID=3076 RepID=A0A2P6TL38_CHLSO|nr:hypothetical protein C2E21_6124 [Chlorella sorokiniana]|eukprot:PRW45003.1 hypothetical protein C2E21_6124 [Chlorella sorokiniana]
MAGDGVSQPGVALRLRCCHRQECQPQRRQQECRGCSWAATASRAMRHLFHRTQRLSAG